MLTTLFAAKSIGLGRRASNGASGIYINLSWSEAMAEREANHHFGNGSLENMVEPVRGL